MTQDHHSSRRNRSLMGQLFVVGNSLFVLLLVFGIVFSILVEGRLPKVRYGYGDDHRRLLETQNNSTVMPHLRTAAAIDFDNTIAQLQLLSTAYEVKDRESVTYALRGLLNHAPDDPGLHEDLAINLLESGKPGDALIHSTRALELDPSSSRLHSTHGAVMLALGKLREAAALYRKALQLNPKSEPAKRALDHPLKNY